MEKDRLKELRKELNLNQEKFGERIGLSKPSISALEKGNRNLTEPHIKLIVSEFSVNETWLRTGEGEMFEEVSSISLDEYAKKNNLSELELDIIRAYMEIDKEVRTSLLSSLENVFNKNSEISVAEDTSTYQTEKDDIEKELESYRLELEAEKKGRMSQVLDGGEEIG